MLHRPGHLLHLEGAIPSDASVIGVREPAGVDVHARQSRRRLCRHRTLGMRSVGEAHRPDRAVAPRLPHQPGHRVVAVVRIVEIFSEHALGVVAAATVLHDDRISVLREPASDVWTGRRLGAGQTDFRSADAALVVRRPLEDHRRAVHASLLHSDRDIAIGGQADAVAHRHHDIFKDLDLDRPADFFLKTSHFIAAARRPGCSMIRTSLSIPDRSSGPGCPQLHHRSPGADPYRATAGLCPAH